MAATPEADVVTGIGTNGDDAVTVAAAGATQVVNGLATQVRVSGGEPADDIAAGLFGGADRATSRSACPASRTFDVDGGPDTDTVTYNGTTAADTIAVTANGTGSRVDSAGTVPVDAHRRAPGRQRPRRQRHDERRGQPRGPDRHHDGRRQRRRHPARRNGVDTLVGGTGNDIVDGQQGNDRPCLGSGNDTFQWDPGDGSDTVEGGTETDTMLFNGSNIGEIFELSANGGRVRFTRNIAAIAMDLDDVERTRSTRSAARTPRSSTTCPAPTCGSSTPTSPRSAGAATRRPTP